jgi:hypothetical protein
MPGTLNVTNPAIPESPNRRMSVLRARCIARYGLHSVPGRPEELVSNRVFGDLPRVISFGYIHGSVRIRKHAGPTNRAWGETRDFTFKDGWLSEAYDFLDSWFGLPRVVSSLDNGRVQFVMDSRGVIELGDSPDTTDRDWTVRPIKDNPQA